jgi:hypothetical protein
MLTPRTTRQYKWFLENFLEEVGDRSSSFLTFFSDSFFIGYGAGGSRRACCHSGVIEWFVDR